MALDSFVGLYLLQLLLDSYIGINSTVTSEYIQVFHPNAFDCLIGFFEMFCNVSAIIAATIPNADRIDTHFVQQ